MIVKSSALAAYALASGLLEPLAGALLRARARRGKEDPARLQERLGRGAPARPPGPLVWLHGVSVGESLSLLPLAEALQRERPGLNLLMTSGTRTSAELLARRAPPAVIHQYAPVDTPGAVARFLDHWRPDLGVLVESELWPNLLLGAKRRGMRLALISARMTEKSARGWSRTPDAARELLSSFELVLPQDAGTERRLQRLGATTGPRLNLKRVGDRAPVDAAELARLQAATAGRKVVLGASTHPGEEASILRAHQHASAGALLILAPRHPDRGAEVTALARGRGLSVVQRSEGAAPAVETDVYVADTLGEMGLFYALADVVVMGGGFAEGVGGHNPLEPARFGKPILTGPIVFNAAELYADLFERVGAIRVADEDALARDLRGLLQHPMIARRIGEAALDYAEAQGAGLEQALMLLKPMLPA